MPRNRGCSQSHLQLSLLYYHHKQLQFNELTNSTHADLRMAHVTGPTVIATQLDPRPFAPHPIAVPGERCSPGSLCNWIPGPGITPKIAILGCLETLGSDCNWIPDYKGQSSLRGTLENLNQIHFATYTSVGACFIFYLIKTYQHCYILWGETKTGASWLPSTILPYQMVCPNQSINWRIGQIVCFYWEIY